MDYIRQISEIIWVEERILLAARTSPGYIVRGVNGGGTRSSAPLSSWLRAAVVME